MRLRVVDELGYPAIAGRLGISEQAALTPNGGFGGCPLVRPGAAPVSAPALRRDKRGRALRVPLQRQAWLVSCVVSGSSALVAPAPMPPSALPVPRPRKHR